MSAGVRSVLLPMTPTRHFSLKKCGGNASAQLFISKSFQNFSDVADSLDFGNLVFGNSFTRLFLEAH